MYRGILFGSLALFLGACVPEAATDGATAVCESMCDELYKTCSYAAFPDWNSCLEGCAYNLEEGADVEGQLACVQEASCDTFKIVECENTYGADSDD